MHIDAGTCPQARVAGRPNRVEGAVAIATRRRESVGTVGQPVDGVVSRESELDLALREYPRCDTKEQSMIHLTLLAIDIAVWAHALIAAV